MERIRLGRSSLKILFGIAMVSIVASYAFVRDTAAGGGAVTPVPQVANPCPRPFAAGSAVHNPPALFSSDGVLNVRFSYEHSTDADGTEHLCIMTPDGLQNPTLHVKPGGILGVEGHRGRPDQPQDLQARSGYVRQDYAIALAEKAGFKLIGSSEVNANPKDTKDYPEGVWTSPPTYRLKDQDRKKYSAIGESDRFVLKFVKPAEAEWRRQG